MIPNLQEATHSYWQKLNALEAAYRRGEVSIEEVDAKVAELTTELGAERRAAIQFLLNGLNRLWQEQREVVLGVTLLGVLTYVWTIVS